MDSIISPNTPEKQCRICKQSKPATRDYFHASPTNADRLNTVCKKCRAEAHQKAHKPSIGENRQCPTCKKWYPFQPEFFYRDKTRKHGLRTECKNCCSKRAREHFQQPEIHKRQREYAREYERKPEVRERRKYHYNAWNNAYLSLPENREHRKAYYKRQEIRDQKRTYRASPEGKAVHRANSHRRRARQKAVQGTYTPEQIQDLLKRQKHKCYYCVTKFRKEQGEYIYHIDHTFPLSRVVGTDIPANDISYLVLACPTCNQKKNDKFPWEFPEGGRLL